jgi:hypothetical protein
MMHDEKIFEGISDSGEVAGTEMPQAVAYERPTPTERERLIARADRVVGDEVRSVLDPLTIGRALVTERN